jgi:hypothetical protein
MQTLFRLDHIARRKTVFAAGVPAEFNKIGGSTHDAHHFIELVDAIAVPMREPRHIAPSEGRLLLRDCVQPKGGIGDDPRAIAARDLAVHLGAVERAIEIIVGAKSVDASMMYSPDGRYRFRQDEKFIAAELSYASDDFRLVVATTKRLPARAHEFFRIMSWLGGADFADQYGLVALPRIIMSNDVELLDTLDAMGLSPARLRRDAFRKFTAVPQTLSRVFQKTKLKINEEGTDAAAATAATTWRSAPMRDYTRMIVNRPFVFALRDQRTGLVMLNGYVAMPT